MKTTRTTKLVNTRGLVEAWRNAVRHTGKGRADRAASLWRRVARAVRALGTDLPRSIVHELAASSAAVHGPSTTPAMRSPAPRHAVSLALTSSTVTLPITRSQVQGVSRAPAFDLMIDVPRQRVAVAGKDLPLEGRGVPLNILATLARAGGGPLTMEELFPAAWGRKFNAAYDSNTVYFHVSRLRKLIEETAPGASIVESCGGAYRLARGLKFALIEERGPARKASRDRSQILSLIADRRFVDNRGYCEIAGVSRSTALRELADLVESGLLVREGAGRGVRYRVAAA